MATIRWSDIKDAARIFCVWVGQPELRFAEEAWAHIVQAGLREQYYEEIVEFRQG